MMNTPTITWGWLFSIKRRREGEISRGNLLPLSSSPNKEKGGEDEGGEDEEGGEEEEEEGGEAEEGAASGDVHEQGGAGQ